MCILTTGPLHKPIGVLLFRYLSSAASKISSLSVGGLDECIELADEVSYKVHLPIVWYFLVSSQHIIQFFPFQLAEFLRGVAYLFLLWSLTVGFFPTRLSRSTVAHAPHVTALSWVLFRRVDAADYFPWPASPLPCLPSYLHCQHTFWRYHHPLHAR